MSVSRRRFVSHSGWTVAGAFASVFGARSVLAAGDLKSRHAAPLAVPDGFSVHILDRGAAAPDGMGCFTMADGSLALMRNHEVLRPFGGVSRLILEPRTLAVRTITTMLSGTDRNCAGGLSPWGWLTCEEAFTNGSGYVYLVSPDGQPIARAEPIRAYGHFNHEAATVDPYTHVAYLTEDRADGCFYRFLPSSRETPFTGRLQALQVAGRPGLATGQALRAGDRVRATWVDVADPDPRDDIVRQAAGQDGAASFSRGEGLWLAGGKVYFTATSGGPVGKGQVFCYEADAGAHTGSGGLLSVHAEATDANGMDMPDSLTVAPWGDVFVAEDGGGDQFVRMVGPAGIATFAENVASSSELAGLCFDPAGETLFLNLQWDGLTVAVRGPFRAWCKAQA